MGYNETLGKYLKAMSQSPDKVNRVSTNDLGSLSDEQRSALSNDSAVTSGERAVQDESHQDTKTLIQRTRDTMRSARINIDRGILNFFDGIGDFFMGAVASVADWTGNYDLEKNMKDAINYDWQSQGALVLDSITSPLDTIIDATARKGQSGSVINAYGSNDKAVEAYKAITTGNYDSNVEGVVNNIEQGLGNMAMSIATGGAIGAVGNLGKWAKVAVNAGIGFVQGAGQGYSTVASKDGDMGKGAGYAAVKGIISAVERGASTAMGGTFSDKARNFVGEKTATKLLGATGNKVLANFAGNAVSVLTDVAVDTGFNFIEEALDPGIQMIFDSSAWDNAYGTEEKRQETFTNLGKSAITSALTSFLTDSARLVVGSDRRDYVQEKIDNVVSSDAELKSDIDKVNEAQEIAKEAAFHADEMTEKLKSASKEEANSIKHEIEIDRQVMESSLQKAAMLSDSVMERVQKKIGFSERLLTAPKDTEIHSTTDNQIKAIWDGKPDTEYHKVGNMEVAKDGDILKYRAETASQAPEAILAITNTHSDKAIIKSSLFGSDDEFTKEYIFESSSPAEELKTVATCLRDTKLTSKTYTEGNKTYIEFSNGTKMHFENGVFKGLGQPSWAKELQSTRVENATESMKRDSAVNGYVKQKDASLVVHDMSEFLGVGWSKDETAKLTKSLGSAWDMAKDDTQKAKAVHDFVEETFKGEFNFDKGEFSMSSTNADEFFELAGVDRKTFEKTMTEVLSDMEVLSTKDKAQMALDKANDRTEKVKLQAEQREYKLKGMISALRNNMKTLNAFHKLCVRAKARVGDSKTAPTPTNPYESIPVEGFYKQFLSQMDFNGTNGRISANKVFTALFGNKTAETVKRANEDASFNSRKAKLEAKRQTFTNHDDADYKELNEKYNKLVENYAKIQSNRVKNPNLGIDFKYDEESIGEFYSEDTKALIDELKSHFESDGRYILGTDKDGNKVYGKTLDIGDVQILSGIIKDSLDQNSEAYKSRIRQEKQDTFQVQVEADAIASSRKRVSFSSSVTGPMYNLRDMFGENSKIYQMFVKDVQSDHYRSARNKYRYMQVLDDAQEEFGISNRDIMDRNVDTELTDMTTGATSKLKMNKGMLMEIYAQSLSSANRQKMMDDGFMIDKVKYVYNDVTENAIIKGLTENERSFVKKVFDSGYNGVIHDDLSQYSINKSGYDYFESNGDYINRSIGNLRLDLSKVDMQMASSLGANISKQRNNNRNPIEIGNFKQHYSTYAGMSADFISMDNVKRNNTLMNLNNPETKENLITTMGKIKGTDGKPSDFFTTWLKLCNNISTTKDGNSSLLSGIYANAMVTPITMNVATFAKMYLDPLRMAKLDGVGWGKTLKGIVKGFASHFSAGNDAITIDGEDYKNRYEYFKTHSGAYIKANAENYAIKSNVISSNYSRVTELLGKPLEFANNDMMSHFAYSICEEKIRAENAGQNLPESEIVKRATDYFDTVSNMTLSNADNLDTSDLRSGRLGSITKSLFGVFGGDNQKKTEYWHEAIMGTSRANKRLGAYQSSYDSLKAKYDMEQEQLTALNDLLETSADEEIPKIKKDIEQSKQNISAYKSAMEGLATDISAEKDYTSPKRVASRLGKVASIAVVSSAIEIACIDSLNKWLKGKDVDGKDILTDLAYDTTIGWVPIVGTIADAVRYSSGIESLQTEGLNSMVSTFSSLIALKDDNSDTARRKALYSTATSMGQLLGIPVKNFMDYFTGAIKKVDVKTATDIETVLNGYSSSYLKKQSQSYMTKGDLTNATKVTQANLAFFKTGTTDWSVAREITKVSAVPRDIPSDLSRTDRTTFMEIYSMSTKNVKNLIKSDSYRLKDEAGRQKAILAVYNAYYDVAKYVTSAEKDKTLTGSLNKALYTYLYGQSKLTKDQKKLLRQYGISI